MLLISLFAISQTPTVYVSSVDAWHAKRIKNLKQPEGWLNLEGLFWLHQGVNSFGSAKERDCFYDFPSFPAYLGDFILQGDSVQWVNKIQKGALVNKVLVPIAEPITVFKVIQGDRGQAAVFNYDQFGWVVIKREDKIGIRFRNFQSKTLTQFKGIERFAVDPKWHIKARLVQPQQSLLMITNVLGQTTAQKNAGRLEFEIDGKSYGLDVIDEGGARYFITFADASSGKTTYGAGRFIEVEKPDAEGNTYIDFNLAYNPPCAFTPFATCPLPPPQNRLTIEIPAGEKKYGHH